MGLLQYLRRIDSHAPGHRGALRRRELEVVMNGRQVWNGRMRIFLVHGNHQRVAYAENGVRIDVLVAGYVERRHQLAIARRADDEMNVRGTVTVALLRADHVSYWSI